MHQRLAGEDFDKCENVKRVNKHKVPSHQTKRYVLTEKIVRELQLTTGQAFFHHYDKHKNGKTQ